MHLEVQEVVQGAVHVHHDPHVPHIQGQSHGEVQEGYEAHQNYQHEQEVVLVVPHKLHAPLKYLILSLFYILYLA
jgi:hypothetical protein